MCISHRVHGYIIRATLQEYPEPQRGALPVMTLGPSSAASRFSSPEGEQDDVEGLVGQLVHAVDALAQALQPPDCMRPNTLPPRPVPTLDPDHLHVGCEEDMSVQPLWETAGACCEEGKLISLLLRPAGLPHALPEVHARRTLLGRRAMDRSLPFHTDLIIMLVVVLQHTTLKQYTARKYISSRT